MAEIKKVAGSYFLQLLKDSSHAQDVALKLGVSTATISTYKKAGKVPVSVELASKFLISQRTNKDVRLPAIRQVVGVVRFPPEKRAFFETITKEMGIKVVYLDV